MAVNLKQGLKEFKFDLCMHAEVCIKVKATNVEDAYRQAYAEAKEFPAVIDSDSGSVEFYDPTLYNPYDPESCPEDVI